MEYDIVLWPPLVGGAQGVHVYMYLKAHTHMCPYPLQREKRRGREEEWEH